jgi:hypothetical protein
MTLSYIQFLLYYAVRFDTIDKLWDATYIIRRIVL